MIRQRLALVSLDCVLASVAHAQDAVPSKRGVEAALGQKEYSPYVGR